MSIKIGRKLATGTLAVMAGMVGGMLVLTAGQAQQSGALAESSSRVTTAGKLLQVPVVNLLPGDVPIQTRTASPAMDDPEAAQRGMDYFTQMNCVGCHAPNGAGGMGPALSNAKFIYGSEPANIYLSILQGRPAGMPAWGEMLPDQVIWDLVAYIKSISKEPSGSWGKTTSASGFGIEQVPAEFVTTTDPWHYTTPFSYGQAPFKQPKGSPPHEQPER